MIGPGAGNKFRDYRKRHRQMNRAPVSSLIRGNWRRRQIRVSASGAKIEGDSTFHEARLHPISVRLFKKLCAPLTTAKVPQGNNCRVDLRGKYADGQSADASNVDVCADKTVDLTN